jgi:hypothetical protein
MMDISKCPGDRPDGGPCQYRAQCRRFVAPASGTQSEFAPSWSRDVCHDFWREPLAPSVAARSCLGDHPGGYRG